MNVPFPTGHFSCCMIESPRRNSAVHHVSAPYSEMRFMQNFGGNSFWLNHTGRVRLLTVAEPDLNQAQALLQRQWPDADVLSWQLIPARVIQMLQMQRVPWSCWNRSIMI